MGKPSICICENKDADQLRGNREANQRFCFRYTDSTLPLLFKSEISSFQPASVTVQPDLCRTCSETTLLVFPRGGSFSQTCKIKIQNLGYRQFFFNLFKDIELFLKLILSLKCLIFCRIISISKWLNRKNPSHFI